VTLSMMLSINKIY